MSDGFLAIWSDIDPAADLAAVRLGDTAQGDHTLYITNFALDRGAR